MFFFIMFGTQDFGGPLKGYGNMLIRCPRCNNNSVHPMKKRNFFTICWIPVLPLSWGEELRCTICGYHQKTSKEELAQISGGNQLK